MQSHRKHIIHLQAYTPFLKGIKAGFTISLSLALSLLLLALVACQPGYVTIAPFPETPSITPSSIVNEEPSPAPSATGVARPLMTATSAPTLTAAARPTLTPATEPPSADTTSPTPFALSALDGCVETQGKVERMQISTEFSPKPLFFQLYLPPCYDPRSTAPYPLLILMHGQANDDQQWIRLGVVDTIDRLIASREIPPFILALPYEEYFLQDPSVSNFGDSVVKGMLPWIDQHYNTCTDRECRGIGGLSRGAGWAIHLGFSYWQQFGAIGAHSLPPFWGDTSRVQLWAKEIPGAQRPKVFLDIGDQDPFLKVAGQFDTLLTLYQIPHVWQINPGLHEDAYWQAHIEEYMRWYSLPWKEKTQPNP